MECEVKYEIKEKRKIYIRSDLSIISEYENGDLMSEYADGTRITRKNSEQKVVIEHTEYKRVVIRYDKVK